MLPKFIWLWALSGVHLFTYANLPPEAQQIERTPSGTDEAIHSEIKSLGSWEEVKAQNENVESMLKRVDYREKYVLHLLQTIKEENVLHFAWPDKIPGSRTPTSDFDVPIWSHSNSLEHLGDDVKAAKLFSKQVAKDFGGPPGKIFDTNIYVKEFSFKSPAARGSSLVDISNQDVASLAQVRRYMSAEEWDAYVAKIDLFQNELGLRDSNQNGRYAKSKLNLEKANERHIHSRSLLLDKLIADDKTQQFRKKFGNLKSSFTDIELALKEIAETNPDVVLEAEYSLYLDGMEKVRAEQMKLEGMKLSPPNNDPTSSETLEWTNQKKVLREEIKGLTGEAVYFAPEAYSSEGAFFHIVKYVQGSKEAQASVLEKITPFDLLCSMNEQAANFLKDVNFHYQHESRIALYQSAKYLKRFYGSIELLAEKIGSSKWRGVRDVKKILNAVEPLVALRREPVASEEKSRKSVDIVGAKKFRDILGEELLGSPDNYIQKIASKVTNDLAKVNAEFRTKYSVHPNEVAPVVAPEEFTLAITDDGGEMTSRPEGVESIEHVEKENFPSATSEVKEESILDVSVKASKFVSRLREAVKSMTKFQIPEAMRSAALRPIFEDLQSRFKVLVPRSANVPGASESLNGNHDASTLNAGMFAIALANMVESWRRSGEKGLGELANVDFAARLQLYANLVGAGAFAVSDLAKIANLAARSTSKVLAEKGIPEMVSTISKVDLASKGILYAVNVGFDVYALWNARNEVERSGAISNLAFDAIGLAVSGTTTILETIGAVGAAEALDVFLTPLAGLQIGITALVQGFAAIGLEASSVGKYFGKLRESFNHAYKLENGSYVPNLYSVVEEINFRSWNVKIGSPYLSKSKHGSTGSGRLNYFFWIGDLPECKLKRLGGTGHLNLNADWKKDVFDIRERMEHNGCGNCKAMQMLPGNSAANEIELNLRSSPATFLLPTSPQSVIGYTYFSLPGATTRNDYGFQVLRDLEGDDFDFDFYIFPSEYLINRIRQYFLDTRVTVVMDDVNRVLVAPKFERHKTNMWNKLSYHIIGSASATDIILGSGVSFTLASPNPSTPVSFVLDSTSLGKQKTKKPLRNKRIKFDDVLIDYSALPPQSSVHLRSKGVMKRLNIANGEWEIEAVKIPSKVSGSVHDVLRHLKNFTQKHHVAERFVAVPESVPGIEGHISYDTHQNILVYTNDPTPSDTQILGVQSTKFGCFQSPSQCRVWCTNLETHEAVVETIPFCAGKPGTIIGSILFSADSQAIIEVIENLSEVQPEVHKETTLHYRYLLSRESCVLVDIHCFAPIENQISRNLRSLVDAVRPDLGETAQIGDGTHPVVPASVADWVTYERLLHGTDPKSRMPELDQRSWYQESTDTAIILDKSTVKMPLWNMTLMPLVHQTPSSPQKKQPNVLIHDSSSAKVFRYEPDSQLNGSGSLALLRADVVSVTQVNTAWIGITVYGSIVQFSSAEFFEIIGYTYDVFNQNETHWASWWNNLPEIEKSRKATIPFYEVKSGSRTSTNIWYVRYANAYVVVDHVWNNNRFATCLGVTENQTDALLVTKSGKMWTTEAIHAKDSADPPTDWIPKNPTEWTPGLNIQKTEKIVGAQSAADGVTITTEAGLVMLANSLTTTTAKLTLRRLRVRGVESDFLQRSAMELYQRAQMVEFLQMPKEHYVPVGDDSKQGYLINLDDRTDVKFVLPTHDGKPLGLDDTEKKMLFFDSHTKMLWSDNTERGTAFDVAVRFGEVLLATSSHEQVSIPKLSGVHKLALQLKAGVQQVIVPDTYGALHEVLVDTTAMASTDVVQVQIPWQGEKLTQRVLRDVGDGNQTLQMVLIYASEKTLRWQGLKLQKITVKFASSGTKRSAAAETELSVTVVKVMIACCVAAVAAIVAGGFAYRQNKKKSMPHQRPQE